MTGSMRSQPQQQQQQQHHHQQAYYPQPQAHSQQPRAPDVYVLSDTTNDAIPEEVRSLLHRDDRGRVLFFHNPPILRPGNGIAPESYSLGHSIRWLADRKRRADADAAAAAARKKPTSPPSPIPRPPAPDGDADASRALDDAAHALGRLFTAFDDETRIWRDESGLGSWDETMAPVRESKAQREAERAEAAKRALVERRAAMRERELEREGE